MLSVNKNVLSGSVPCLENKITFIWGSYVHDWPNPAVREVQVMKPRIDVNNSVELVILEYVKSVPYSDFYWNTLHHTSWL